MLYSVAALLGVLATSSASSSSRLVSEQVQAYRKLIGTERLTAEGFRKIFKYHDDDSVCAHACGRHLEKLINDHAGMEWTRLEELIDSIYGDAISNDPFQPQEVHLALTGSLGEMKVIWASMDGLQNPFVEYAPADDESDTWTSQPATTDTYTVPQNWYPAFAGVIYEANMVDLVPGKKAYKYRVGGLDAVNNVVRRSKDFTFSSAPEPAPDQKTTFATFGDQVQHARPVCVDIHSSHPHTLRAPSCCWGSPPLPSSSSCRTSLASTP